MLESSKESHFRTLIDLLTPSFPKKVTQIKLQIKNETKQQHKTTLPPFPKNKREIPDGLGILKKLITTHHQFSTSQSPP